MKRFLKKLKNNKGETLIEALAAILIIALASSALLYSVINAADVNRKAAAKDTEYRQEVNEVEGRTHKTGSGMMTIKDSEGKVLKNISVEFYGDGTDSSSGLTGYQKASEESDGN